MKYLQHLLFFRTSLLFFKECSLFLLSVKKLTSYSKFLSKKIIKTQNILNLNLEDLILKYPIYIVRFFSTFSFYKHLFLQRGTNSLSLITYIYFNSFKFLDNINLVFLFNPLIILVNLKSILKSFKFFLNKI